MKSFTHLASMRTWRKVALLMGVLMAAGYYGCLPTRLFERPYSTVLYARGGQLLGASIASDGQWRFPQNDTLPEKFIRALTVFEDKRYFSHPGVDVLAMGRAMSSNIRSGKIVSGGSTLTMQVVRLARRRQPRTVHEKLIEMILASRLEWRYTKEEILAMYASHAPFGGNVVGLDAACWRYFGRPPQHLSWAEAAMLAVLPNAPALMHPGKNRAALKEKRDRLLERLHGSGAMDSLTCALSKQEMIPAEPQPLPRMARHLLARMTDEGRGGTRLRSTIDYRLQEHVEQTLGKHHLLLSGNQIHNAAVLVLDVKTGGVLAYAGNVGPSAGSHGEEVDIISAPRSTGSILKPLLYAAALDEGLILPHSLLADIPVLLNGFSPQNFSRQYDGAVPASQALIRSLNVPSVFLLRDYRYEKFHTLLQNLGLTTLRRPADHYGLSLVLGGAEATLWDITGVYASMARTLTRYFDYPGGNRYRSSDFHSPEWTPRNLRPPRSELSATSLLSASSIYLTFENLVELYRPAEESGWRQFNTSKKIAWKTGTSFGFRDGWAIGVTPEFAVGVWVGNADGEGRAGLTGTHAAAPLMFDVFSHLPPTSWFPPPRTEMHALATCRKSGLRRSPNCESSDTVWVPEAGLRSPACSYHQIIHLSKDKSTRLHTDCADLSEMHAERWFILPPVQEHFYRARNLSYRPLPPWGTACSASAHRRPMNLIYPAPHARIVIPRDFDGKPAGSVFELAHQEKDAEVFWHLDGTFIGVTKGIHQISINPDQGSHVLTLVDRNGFSLKQEFEVISTP